jgi:hypothetical protein
VVLWVQRGRRLWVRFGGSSTAIVAAIVAAIAAATAAIAARPR